MHINNRHIDTLSSSDYNTYKVRTMWRRLLKHRQAFCQKEEMIITKLNNFIEEVRQNIYEDDYYHSDFDIDNFSNANKLKDIYGIVNTDGTKISISEIKKQNLDNFTRKKIKNIQKLTETLYLHLGYLPTLDVIKRYYNYVIEDLDKFNNPEELAYDNKKLGSYISPENGEKYLEMFFKDFNEERQIIYDISLTDLAIIHLIFYAIHPFKYGNELLAKVYEKILIKVYYDDKNYLVGMGYWFNKDKKNYYHKIKQVLSGEEDVLSWIEYYLDSFETMVGYSKNLYKVKRKFKFEYLIPEDRIKFYNPLYRNSLSGIKDNNYVVLIELIAWINTTKNNEVTLDMMLDILGEYKPLYKLIEKVRCLKICKFTKDKILIPNFEKKGFYSCSAICRKKYKLNDKILEYYR